MPDYADVRDAEPLRRYVNTYYGINEPCEFPNQVWRGWVRDREERAAWRAEFCPWEPGIVTRVFDERELSRLKLLKWEIAQRRVEF